MNRIECGCTESDFDSRHIDTTIIDNCYIILECGNNILQEYGDNILKEHNNN